jgi:hypothetical protein
MKAMNNGDISLTVYQGKTSMNVLLFSSLHPTVTIGSNQMKTPETVSYYDEAKYGVGVVVKKASQYSVKASSRKWLVHTFYSILDMAAINAAVIYRSIKKSKLPRRNFHIKCCRCKKLVSNCVPVMLVMCVLTAYRQK